MKYLLAPANRAILAEYAHARVMLAFDFDGTLAPITAVAGAAQMRPSTRERFERVAERYPCVVISGRSRADVARRVTKIPVAATIGNHGVEPSRDMQHYVERVAEWHAALAPVLARLQGVQIEDKRYSLSLHYRGARNKRETLATLRDAVAELGSGVRTVSGKQVLNLVPISAPHKGMALVALRESLRAEAAIYLGDDVTDEDVFGLDEPGRLLSVRVGKKLDSRADYYLKTQREVDALLERLCALRPGPVSLR